MIINPSNQPLYIFMELNCNKFTQGIGSPLLFSFGKAILPTKLNIKIPGTKIRYNIALRMSLTFGLTIKVRRKNPCKI